jgi:hypothetical protein
VTTVSSLRRLLRLVSLDRVPAPVARVLVACGLAPSRVAR